MNAPTRLHWPAPDEIAVVPEIAALAMLDAALAIAEMHLLVENPQIGDPSAARHPADHLVWTLLDDLRAAGRSLATYVDCVRALASEARRNPQGDLPF
jgi:hypothetical protein